MSAFSLICGYGYGSNSDDSEGEIVPKDFQRSKLPTPDLSKVTVVPVSEEYIDDPDKHSGRTRSFPHVRGNWATFVYIKYPEETELLGLIDKLQSEVNQHLSGSVCQKCDDFHISLSRTVVLTYHLITPFTTSLQEVLSGIKSINLFFDSIKVYCNEDKTRTFLALKADHSSNKNLQNLTGRIDEILTEYKLPTFYEDPSFHMSILWINGNKKDQIENILDNLNHIVANEIGKSLDIVTVDKVNCKSGNKQYQFSLI